MTHAKKVIAGVIEKNNLILLAQRGKRDHIYGKWEFPGGKVEDGETDQECLIRELYEEFGIHAEIGNHLCDSAFIYNNQSYIMRAYHVPAFTGNITLTEHLQIQWVSIDQLQTYDVPEPDKPIVATLTTSSKLC